MQSFEIILAWTVLAGIVMLASLLFLLSQR